MNDKNVSKSSGLSFTVRNTDTGKVVILKKQSYMNDEYLNFLLKGLNSSSIAEEICYTYKIKSRNIGTDSVGIILNKPHVEDCVLDFVLAQITSDFFRTGDTIKAKDKMRLSNSLEALFKGNKENPVNRTPRSSTIKESMNRYDICPNVVIQMLREKILLTYETFIDYTIAKQSGMTSLNNGRDVEEELLKVTKVMDAIRDELCTISKMEIDCNKCPAKGNC